MKYRLKYGKPGKQVTRKAAEKDLLDFLAMSIRQTVFLFCENNILVNSFRLIYLCHKTGTFENQNHFELTSSFYTLCKGSYEDSLKEKGKTNLSYV